MFLFLRFTHQKWLVFHDRTYNYSFFETYLVKGQSASVVVGAEVLLHGRLSLGTIFNVIGRLLRV